MTSSKPLISILVPVFNAGRYVSLLCDSLREQSHEDFEVLFLDDGSSDDSWQRLQAYRGDSRFKMSRWKPNRGLNAAWFELLTQASGKYWCSPGADDVLDPDFLRSRLGALEANPHAIFAHGPPKVIDSEGGLCRPVPDFHQAMHCVPAVHALNLSLNENHFNQPGLVVRTDLTRLVLPYFSTSWVYAPDWYLWILLLSIGQEIVWDPKPVYQYRVHGSSLSLHPSKEAVRAAEGRLVPLCGLSTAAGFSHSAARVWFLHRRNLYRLWLVRAVRLCLRRQLRNEWRAMGASAYYRAQLFRPLPFELLTHSIDFVRSRRAPFDDQSDQSGIYLP